MSSSSFRFSLNSPAAEKLVLEVHEKLKEVWESQLTDHVVAQYVVGLVGRGQDRKKIAANLQGVLPDDATTLLLDWWVSAACVCSFTISKTHAHVCTPSSACIAHGCSPASCVQAAQACEAAQEGAHDQRRTAKAKVSVGVLFAVCVLCMQL